MNYFSGQITLLASNNDEESAFWMTMLVLAVLASLVWVGNLIKTRAERFKGQQRYYTAAGRGTQGRISRAGKMLRELKGKFAGIFLKVAQRKAVAEEPTFDSGSRNITGRGKRKDLAGGMEMLKRDFLVSIVENTQGDDKNDVTLRKLSFDELARRGELKAADSKSLTVYAVNEGNLYDKGIQCEAMKELAGRTGPHA
jgi:hypothetical protein